MIDFFFNCLNSFLNSVPLFRDKRISAVTVKHCTEIPGYCNKANKQEKILGLEENDKAVDILDNLIIHVKNKSIYI